MEAGTRGSGGTSETSSDKHVTEDIIPGTFTTAHVLAFDLDDRDQAIKTFAPRVAASEVAAVEQARDLGIATREPWRGSGRQFSCWRERRFGGYRDGGPQPTFYKGQWYNTSDLNIVTPDR